MDQHHRESIDNLIEGLKQDQNVLALILSGSLAKGNYRPDSDIDVFIVVTDEDFERRRQTNDTCYFNSEACVYPGGYIDGKIINKGFVEKAALQGSEPTKASFLGSYVLWSKVEGLNELVTKIATYDDEKRLHKMESFYAQVQLWGGFFHNEGVKKNNTYLVERSITELVFYASRYILAKNRILFPCHKTMMEFVNLAACKPRDYAATVEQLLKEKRNEQVSAFLEMFNQYAECRLTNEQCVARFIEDSEWNWINSPPPLQDC
jgi:hypothetical protein